MVRRNLPVLGASLVVAVLLVGACGGGSPTPSAVAGAASPSVAAPTAVPVTPTAATPAPASSTPAATASASAIGPNDGRIAFGVRTADGSQRLVGPPRRHRSAPADEWRRESPVRCLHAQRRADRLLRRHQRELRDLDDAAGRHRSGAAHAPAVDGPSSRTSPATDKQVAFGGVQGEDEHTEVYVVDASTGDGLWSPSRAARDASGGCSNDFPVWSPDGKSIAFIHTDDFDADDNPVNSQVWVMDADGGHQRTLTTDSPMKDQVPDWSPDGSADRLRQRSRGQRRGLGDERRRLQAAPAVGVPSADAAPCRPAATSDRCGHPTARASRSCARSWRRAQRAAHLHDEGRWQRPGPRVGGDDPGRRSGLAAGATAAGD